ncbi:hypothetical protein ACF0H5_017446 [Mactra antiquata]
MLELKRDGGWGWVVLFSVLCSQTILGGICLSGGLFYVMFMNALGSDPVETSWLCSLPITMWFTATPFGSFITNKYGYRACSFIGGIIAALGLSLGYFARHIGFLFFSHGILTGIGLGLNYTGCMTALNVYFDNYKTIATGLSSIGHNLGMVLYAEVLGLMEEEYGWRGTMLLQGAITFHLCAFASVMLPLAVRNEGKESTNQIDRHISDTSLVKKKLINVSVFKKVTFILFCVSNVFVNFSQGVYILHLPSYSRDAGFSTRDFGKVLMVYGVCNIIGKVVYSLLGQHPKFNTMILYTVSLTATGLAIGLTPVFLSVTGMMFLAGLVGFFYCVTGALLQAVIYGIVGYDRFADGVGMSLPFKATGNLIGGPFAGFLFATTGNYATSFYLAGISMVIGSVLMIHPILYQRKQRHHTTHKDHYTVCEISVNDKDKLRQEDTIFEVKNGSEDSVSETEDKSTKLTEINDRTCNTNGSNVTDLLLKQ